MNANSEPAQDATPLERARGQWLLGDKTGAVLLAVSMLEAQPAELGAVLLLAQALIDADRVRAAGPALEALVDGYADRGDLPAACVAAKLGEMAGGFAAGALGRLAEQFCKESPYRGAPGLPPPPLPGAVKGRSVTSVPPAGPPLLEAAERALLRFVHARRPRVRGKVPALPLFGELSRDVLARLLGSFTVLELPAGASVVEEGQEGDHVFVVVSGLLHAVRGQPALHLADLRPGAIFGEMALLSGAPRAASVVALKPVQLLSVDRFRLEQLTQMDPAIGTQLGHFCRRRLIGNLIRHSPLLGRVEPADRAGLMERFTVQTYVPGQPLLRQGTDNDRLILIASGALEVRRRDRDGDQVRIAALGPGDVAGEISLLMRRPATADVLAIHNTVTLELPAAQFQEVIKEQPALLCELYELSVQRDDEIRSVVGQEAIDVSDAVLL